MKIINNTEIPTSTVKEIVRWLTKGITRRIAKITFSYTRKHGNSGYIDYVTKIIRVAVARDGYPYPMNYWRNAHFNFPKYEVNNPLENLVATLAHELGHLRKHIHHQRNTEQKVEKYAFKKLQEFRKWHDQYYKNA